MSSKKLTKKSLVNYVQEQVENLYKLHVLKEQKEINTLKETKEKSEYSEKAKKFISNKLSKMDGEDKPQDQKVAIALSMAREKGLKVPDEKTKTEHKQSKVDNGALLEFFKTKGDRDKLIEILKAEYPNAWFKPGEDFGGDYTETTIWSGEGSYANNGMKLFDPYSDNYKVYPMEVYKPFEDFVESKGYYVEPYDAGTFFILPI